MDLFSVLYDPSTSSPFGVEIEHSDGTKSLYGLSTAGRGWANTGSAPETIIRTGFAPYTKSAQEAMEPAIDGSIVLSLAEIREYANPELIYVGRTIKNRNPESINDNVSEQNNSNNTYQTIEGQPEEYNSTVIPYEPENCQVEMKDIHVKLKKLKISLFKKIT